MLRAALSGPVLALFIAIAACANRTDGSCGDLLAAIDKKPANLEYVECKARADLQGAPQQASYRVTGAHAAEVESYLAKELSVTALHRTCCVWESTENSFRSKEGRLFVIAMATEETKIDRREEWSKIPSFTVTVNLYREDP
jgi:hypothetical protein